MQQCIRPLAVPFLIAQMLVVANLCSPPSACSQDVTNSGDSMGDFGPATQSGAATRLLSLDSVLAIRKGTSPGFLIATAKVGRKKRQFAFLCVIHHEYSGDQNDEFPKRIVVVDNKGDIEQKVRVRGSSLNVEYSFTVTVIDDAEPVEALEICGTPVDLEHGRLFVVELFSNPPVVTQFDYRLPAAPPPQKCERIGRKVSNDLEAVEDWRADEKRVLKLLPDREEPQRKRGRE